MLLTVCALLALILFFVVVFCALYQKRHFRAMIKGPLNSFHIEFEADDETSDPKP